ncbi:MAG: exonuclease domain-containing protein [Ilumatobacteraceae bacterium]
MSSATTPHDLAEARFAVVDVETSGLSPTRHRVLQVAVVVADGSGNVLDSWVSLVRPRWRWMFRLGPRHIHGLDRASLRKAPPASDVFSELADRLAGTTFTAHNASFDAAFLQRGAHRLGIALELSTQLCTLRMSRKLDPNRQVSHRLADVSARYGVSNAKPHDALEDALATAAVLPHLLRAHSITTIDQLEPFMVPRPARPALPHHDPARAVATATEA